MHHPRDVDRRDRLDQFGRDAEMPTVKPQRDHRFAVVAARRDLARRRAAENGRRWRRRQRRRQRRPVHPVRREKQDEARVRVPQPVHDPDHCRARIALARHGDGHGLGRPHLEIATPVHSCASLP